MRAARIATLTVGLVLVLAVAAVSLVSLESFDPVPDPGLALGTYTHPAGGTTLQLNVGIGSGAYRGPFDFFPFAIWDFLFQPVFHQFAAQVQFDPGRFTAAESRSRTAFCDLLTSYW